MKINTIFTQDKEYKFTGAYEKLGVGGNIAEIIYPDGQVKYPNRSIFSSKNADLLENVKSTTLSDVTNITGLDPYVVDNRYAIVMTAITYARRDPLLRYKEALEAKKLLDFKIKCEAETLVFIEQTVKSILYGDFHINISPTVFSGVPIESLIPKYLFDENTQNYLKFNISGPLVFRVFNLILIILKIIHFYTKILIYFT